MSDGPPWTVGQNCTLTLRHAAVNANTPTGFYLKPDSFRWVLPKAWYRGTNLNALLPAGLIDPGKRIVELTVVSRANAVHADGTPSLKTATQWHDALSDYLVKVNQSMTLVDPSGVSWVVGMEEVEDRLSPLGGQFLLEWETRIVFIEL